MIKRRRSLTLEEQYKQQGECCYYCKDKVPFEMITRDHFESVSKGNTFVNNKIYACRYCNSTKGSGTILEFKETIIERICKILTKVQEDNYKITEDDLKKLAKFARILKTLNKIIENGNKPEMVFT